MDAFGSLLLAVSDPTRRSILAQLSKAPARVGDIAATYPMSLNAVSKHVKVLERVGLVRRTKLGRDHILELDAEPLRQVARWALTYERYWDHQLDQLRMVLENRRKSDETPGAKDD